MYLSLWRIRINSRNEDFATHSPNVETALKLFKAYYKKRYPDKGFNVEKIERVTGIEYLVDDEGEEL